jgi:colicin import membrane protein
LRPYGPDIAVIFGARERQNWSTFHVAEEDVAPTLIVEVTAPATAALDRSAKLEGYELAGVPIYVIVDAVSDRLQSPVRLLGHELRDGCYQMLPLNERGWLWLAPVRVWLGVDDGEIVCYDEASQPLLDFPALVASRMAAERRAEELEASLREMEAELRRLREGNT